jgi:hypothetical protein
MKFCSIVKNIKFRIKRCFRRFLSIFPCVNKYPQEDFDKKVDPEKYIPESDDIECPKFELDKLGLEKLEAEFVYVSKKDINELTQRQNNPKIPTIEQ